VRVTTQQAFAAALLAPGSACPDGLLTHNGSDPEARFAVYRNNVVSSLIDALADTFPVAQALVGAEFFRAMAKVFVLAAPPRSRVLAVYGEAFPDFVQTFEPARAVPYLADVARLEMARVRACHAADRTPLTVEEIADATGAPEDLPRLQVTLHPSLAVVRSDFAVVSLWAAHQDLGDIARVDPCVPEDALVVRNGLDVEVIRLAPGSAAFVTALTAGGELAGAVSRAHADAPAFDLPATLAILIRAGAITALRLPARQSP
jgi:hypothetical protein